MKSESKTAALGDSRPGTDRRGAAAEPDGDEHGTPRLTLEEKIAGLKVRRRDCRTCRAFHQDESGMSFGWCTAFEQYVKLYHPAGEFWSQCQFKVIARTPCSEAPPSTQISVERASPAPSPAWAPVPAVD